METTGLTVVRQAGGGNRRGIELLSEEGRSDPPDRSRRRVSADFSPFADYSFGVAVISFFDSTCAFTGEGIGKAMEAGIHAAEAILAGNDDAVVRAD